MQDTLTNDATVGRLAKVLRVAEEKRQPAEPLTDDTQDLSLSQAYAIQQLNIDLRKQAGEKVVGHKIGLTAKAMQELFGVDEPDYGHIMDTMMHPSSRPLDMSLLIDPQIEVEPAFVLSKGLMGPRLTTEDVLDATEYVATCFEIIDSRITDWRIKLQDTVADNGSSALVVMGGDKIGPRDVDLSGLHTTLEIDGELVEQGDTSAILGHPANGIAWLANKISEFGVGLKAGDIVLPGTCTRSFRIGGRESARGHIDKIGAVTLSLTGKPTILRS